MDIKILKAQFDATHPEYEIPEEPEWFDEDVTLDRRYHNSNLSKGLF